MLVSSSHIVVEIKGIKRLTESQKREILDITKTGDVEEVIEFLHHEFDLNNSIDVEIMRFQGTFRLCPPKIKY